MTTLGNKIFTLKQNHLMKKMKEIHFLNNLISDSEKIIPYPLSCEIINRTFTPYRNIELSKENFSLSIKNEILNFFAPEENDIAYVYFYGGIHDSAEIPIELFPLFIIKMKNISNWLELINKPNFYCLKFFSNKIDKVIDISLLDNEEGCIRQHGTLTGKNLKSQKSNFNPKKTKTRGNKCHSFVENKIRDAKRQKAVVTGSDHILKIGCKNLLII